MHTLALLDGLTQWWDGLNLARQVFFGIGLAAGAVALVLAVLAVFGLEQHDTLDALDAGGFDHGGGGIFSIKPLTGFFLGFGWVGALVAGQGAGLPASIAAALGGGSAVMGVVVLMIRGILSMRSDGTMDITSAVGQVGTVYVTLPASRKSGGQIILNLQGRQETLPALNAADRAVASGEKVRVVSALDSRTLLVEPLA
jgi:hypothetical protein